MRSTTASGRIILHRNEWNEYPFPGDIISSLWFDHSRVWFPPFVQSSRATSDRFLSKLLPLEIYSFHAVADLLKKFAAFLIHVNVCKSIFC